MEHWSFITGTKLALLIMMTVAALNGCTIEQPANGSEVISTFENSLKKKDTAISPEIYKADLEEIKKRGKLIALTGYSLTSYFIYKGTPMGFEYDLLNKLCDELGVKLEIVIVNNMDEIFDKLNNGEGDIIADNLAITKEWDALVDFTIPYHTSRQILVQRLPYRWQNMSSQKLEASLIRSPVDLIDKAIHVRKESAYYQRLRNLSQELGADLQIKEVNGDVETEELIRMVANGEIDHTVADEHVALINKAFYNNIDVSTPISFPQRIAWAVRENSPDLLQKVNEFLEGMLDTPKYYAIYNKYYRHDRQVQDRINCNRTITCSKKISPYDDLIIKAAQEIDIDWRLLTSIIYQESRFDPKARSWAGATGLMQLMPATAKGFGVEDLEDPFQNVTGGCKYLAWLHKYWENKVPDEHERLKFILASYNVGQEHVADAARLAKKYGKDPTIWDDNVALYLLLKSKEKYNTDPVVKYGYCRGEEPFAYVKDVLERYEHYKKLLREDLYLAANN